MRLVEFALGIGFAALLALVCLGLTWEAATHEPEPTSLMPAFLVGCCALFVFVATLANALT